MKKKIATKQSTAFSGTYKLILFLAVLLSLTAIFVIIHLQAEIDHMALAEKIYYMQK